MEILSCRDAIPIQVPYRLVDDSRFRWRRLAGASPLPGATHLLWLSLAGIGSSCTLCTSSDRCSFTPQPPPSHCSDLVAGGRDTNIGYVAALIAVLFFACFLFFLPYLVPFDPSAPVSSIHFFGCIFLGRFPIVPPLNHGGPFSYQITSVSLAAAIQ